MQEISFTVYGEPKAKARPYFGKNSKRPFTPDKTRQAEYNVQAQAAQHRPDELMTGPIVLGMKFYKSIPKSYSKKKMDAIHAGELHPTGKPDLDNLIKLIKDSLNGIFWKDDAQVIEYMQGTGKYYSDTPRVEIIVREI